MKKKIIIASTITIALIFLIIGEPWLRTFTKESIPINIAQDIKVEANAFKQSDFLWSGTAWWIDVTATEEIEITLNSEWTSKLQKGQHKIFYNHDYTNTDKYSERYYKVPKTITIKKVTH